jgi:ABC-type nitrate/sulfonate/bicarbonate transport system permease component/NAD(P)-dependent dehydrogenase (short-subunit alcohol dehydrogenase family)
MRGYKLQLIRLAVVLAILAVWQLAGGKIVPSFVSSSPYDVVRRLAHLFGSGSIWPDLGVTIREFALGYAIGVAAGVGMGIFLGSVKWVGRILEPVILALNSIPHIALAPVFVLLLGLGVWSKVAIAALIVGFVCFIYVYSGMLALTNDLSNVVRVMGGNVWHVIRYVTGPAISPAIMAGLKAGAPLAMIGVVVGEFIASNSGIGYYVLNSSQNFDAAGLWAGLVILVAVVVAMGAILAQVERWVLRWLPRSRLRTRRSVSALSPGESFPRREHYMNSPEAYLAGKTALVTGAGRNIGRAIAVELASRGANVVINVRSNQKEARSVERELKASGVRTLIVLGDVSDAATVERIRAETRDQLGGVDIYVSNASRRLRKDFFSTTNEDWHRHLNMQLTASWYLAKAFAGDMRDKGWGRIIHINGADGWHGGWTRVPHSTAKGGLRTLTKSLAAGLGEYGITVNDVAPGYVDTVRDPETHPHFTPEFEKELVATIPIRRLPSPEEVAWACSFLCSPLSAAITGSVIHVDGGRRMLG